MNRVTLAIVAVLVGIGFAALNRQPRDISSLSDDPWFQNVVVHSKEPVVVKFTADWCGACKSSEEHLTRVQRQYGDKVRIVRVDIDKKRELADSFDVHFIPRIMMIRDGKLVSTFNGSYDRLGNWVESNL